MSIDFDSTTLPIQHAEEEYDKEDYEREQELHQLLMTGLPDDMLEDSRDICSPELNYSRCSANNRGEQTWGQKGNWNDRDANSSLTDKVSYSAENPVPNGQNRGYIENDQYQRDYLCNAEYEQKIDPEQQDKSEPYLNGWNQNYRIDECQFTYKSKGHNFPCVKTNDEHYVSGKSYESNYCQLPDSYSSSDYHDYVNEPIEELHDQLEKMPEYPGSERDQPEHLQHFISNDTAELYKVKYNPYPTAHAPGGLFKTDEAQGAGNRFEEQQSKFLDCGEGSTEAHRFAQLQILYNARGRKLEEMQHKQEECAREIRYLNHQLAMTKGEKEGIAISCQELRNLLQNAKELEVRLEGQIKALESRIQDLGAGEEEALKNQKVAEAAMESMQQQLSELSRSESLTRAREQHENIISAFKDKHEETLLAMQQTLDATSISLEEQKENAKRLGEQVKQLQREQEEAKVEKAEIINGLTKSLEASQQQCRDLLQTGSMQEITQLRIQLQQLQSARNISDNMNKALQEELADLKEQIGLYESAAKVNAILKEVPEALESPLSDSYMGLCIKNDNLKMPKLQSAKRQGDLDKTLCKDGAIRELKGELERSLGNIRTKRHQVAQLQNELKQNQRQIAELKELLQNAEQLARNHEVRAISLEKQLETNGYASDKTLQDIVEQLRCETRSLHKEIEDKQQEIEKLIHSENQFKAANQDLYNEMRRMIQDFDQDKQEAIDRCERIHQQHHEDSKCRLEQELTEQHELEKAQITQFYEQQITQANAQLEQLNQEMSGVQESYITICKEKDSLECRLREEMSLKLTTEQEMKRTFSVQLQDNLTELHGKHKVAMEAAKQQWMAAKEIDIKLQIESQLGLAKTQWQEEQQKIKEQAIQEIETEWQLRLHKAVEQNTYLKRETGSQNKESFDREKEVYTCQELEAQIASLKMTMEQQAKEEKIVAVGKALQQLELELQKKHEDNIARQENKVDLQNALRQTEKQHEEYKTEKEAQLRKLELSELQLKQELNHLQQTLNITQPKELKRDHTSGTQNVNLECHQYEEQYQPQVLRKFQQECQQLKKKLEKMSRQLQLAVHEHKIDVMHLKEEHERTIKMMQNEKDDLLKKLKEKEIIGNKTNSCLQENCSSENSTKLISAKGLEEIRHQYLRAVDKIREDMLRYIQESKVRAAEMIRTEVFRERQQTARKMRKYYLTCLHQLLTDGGKNEGAEKKIMNAAGKLAAMAKAIETPLQNRKRDKAEIHTAQLTKKSSETAPNISENNGGVPASVHLQANQNVNSSSSEGQIQKFKKHTTDNATRKVSTPQIRNKSLFGAAVENSTSDEELSTTAKHVHSHKHKGKSGIFLKDATSMVNGAMSKSKYHRATSIAHCQNSSKYLSQMSLSKAHVFSSIDSLSDKAQLQTSCRQNSNLLSKELVQLRMACNQDNISSLKGYSENFICSETFTKPSSDVCETPERDDSDCAVNYDASNPHKMDRLSFKQTKGNTCHLDDYKMPIKCKMTSGISMSLSATNMQHKPVPISNGIEASPSISSAASDISSLSEDENACYLKKKIPALSRLHTQFAENACATNNREQSNTRTETGILYLTKDLIQKKHPSANSQNIGNIQQDSGFDSPFLNFH
ncbi:centrosomal protein of 152 kDa isoform X3 [Leucoraja erinacea]|uniref:centrosomal protein of 152 kDa isoform X3 n=1 Tax=Leucoraja erinaceus TaxID=7782 RepID=UPI002458C408|nr:centrosomal protein of 152 kDa isoform X3 [Leucoraja erinacea]